MYILGVLLVSLLLVLGMLVAALTSDKVETAAVQMATEEISRALGTHATVGGITYRFPARLAIKDIYIEDQQQDTLLYIGEAFAQFKPSGLRKKEIIFSHVRLKDVAGEIYKVPSGSPDGGEVWNYQFLADAFAAKEKKENNPLQSLISVRDIELENIRLRYEDYHALLTYASMDLHQLSAEGIDAQINNARGEVKGLKDEGVNGLRIEDLAAHVIANDSLLRVPTLTARLTESRLDMSGIEVRYSRNEKLKINNEDSSHQKSGWEITDFQIGLHEVVVIPSELALFAPQLRSLHKPLGLTGVLAGDQDSLYFHDIEIKYNGQMFLQGEVSAVGFPDLEKTYVRANLVDLHTTPARVQDFLSQLKGRPVRLPKEIMRLGDTHYRGLAEGHLYDMTLHGAFRTGIGVITTDGRLESDTSFSHIRYNAHVVGKRLRLGRLVGHAALQSATIDIRSKGEIEEGQINGDIDAHVRDLTYNGYSYKAVQIHGHYTPKRYQGNLSIADEHLNMDFSGLVDLREKFSEVNCDLICRHFDASPLGIERLKDWRSKFKLSVDMEGVTSDKMHGYAVLDSFFFATQRDSILMRQMRLLVSAATDGNKSFSLESDYLKAQADGCFRYADLLPAFQSTLHHYLPSAVEAPKKRHEEVSLAMEVQGYRLRDLQRLFTAPVTISDHPTLFADFTLPRAAATTEPQTKIRFYAPGVRVKETPLHDLTITLNTIDTLRHAGSIGGSGLALSISAEAMNMHTIVSNLAFRDTLLTQVTLRQEDALEENLPEGWKEMSPRELQHALSKDLTSKERQRALVSAQRAGDYGGDLSAVTHFGKYGKRPLIDIHFLPGDLLLRDSIYRLGDSRLTYCAADTTITISNFLFEGGGQHIIANGVASPRTRDTLSVDLQKIDASYVVPFILPVQTIMFNGLLTGEARIISAMKHPLVDTEIHIDSMGLNNCYFGEADVKLQIQDSLAFHADVMRPTRKVVDLNGAALFDGSGKWVLDMTADSVPLAFINHWTGGILSDLDGHGSGHVCVGGRKGLVYVLLRCEAQDASFTLPWTGARYTIPHDTIVMDTTAILFPNVHVVDNEGNKVEVNGGVYHDQFRDFGLDIHVDVHDALAFDSQKKGEMLQGKVYASGHVDVTGDEKDILVHADARTTGKSSFRLSIDNASSAYESNFIHFVPHEEKKENEIAEENDLDNIDIKAQTRIDSTLFQRAARCLLTLNLEVNPQLLFQLVLGERNGDVIQGRGNGALRLSYDTETGDVRLLGTYDIDQGTLNYTVANVIRREFTVAPGSTIVFSGDVEDPQLDVTAQYRVTANLKDLFGDEINQVGTTRTNIPVLTCLHMTGTLKSPILSFSLEFPLSDQAIQQQVRQVINTDEMLMRQVIYLLVFGRFFTPDYLNQAQYATLNSTYSLLSSTVTGQINSWLSKLTDIFTLGVAIRTNGEGAGSSQEYEAQFQLQPVDRLVINGNVGYRYNDISNQPFFGDLDVELLLTEDGQFRLKGYTHTVDKYSLRQATTMQGVSLLWKKDFNSPNGRHKKKEKRQK